MTLLAGILFCASLVVLAWPWIQPPLERRDVPGRLLDRLRDEWQREGTAAPREPWNW